MTDTVGDRPNNWVEIELAALGKWGSGGTPSRAVTEYFCGGIPWIKIGDLKDGIVDSVEESISEAGLAASSARILPPETLLVAMYGASIGKLGITAFPAATNQAIASCQPDQRLTTSKFLFWVLLHRRADLTALGQGGAQPNISQTILKSVRIWLPPLAEQELIIRKLDDLYTRLRYGRESLDPIPKLLELFRQQMLATAFRGKLTTEWRAERELQQVEATLVDFPAPAQPRGGKRPTNRVIPGLGGLSVGDPKSRLPEGWSWVPLLRVARQETGHTPTRANPAYWTGDIPWIGIADAAVHHGRVVHDTIQHVSEAGLANSSARLLPRGTVCLSRTASIGYVVIMGRDMATSQDFATWTCTPALEPEYLMFALMSEGEYLRRFGMGSTHTTIYFPEIRALHIALPPVQEQQEIVRQVKAALVRIDGISEAVRSYAGMFDLLERAILSAAFRGSFTTLTAHVPVTSVVETNADKRPNTRKRRRPSRR